MHAHCGALVFHLFSKILVSKTGILYNVSTYFRLELMEPSARVVFIIGLWMRGKSGMASEERKREYGSTLARLGNSGGANKKC